MNVGEVWELAGESVVLFGGVLVTLYAFRVAGGAKPEDENYEKWEEWHAKYGWLMKVVGPLVILFALYKIGSIVLPHI